MSDRDRLDRIAVIAASAVGMGNDEGSMVAALDEICALCAPENLDGDIAVSRTPWMRDRDEWVKGLGGQDIQRIVEHITKYHMPFDENDGDRAETADALNWLMSRGQDGDEWGIVGAAARELNLWSSPSVGQGDTDA